ncbi:MAG: hypothetical protein IJS50_06120, partial [Desulfovibrio sp.]|nr:hypothetical protein [Desulfovibrio sp.]
MNKYYIAPNKKGRLVKIVMDVNVPTPNKTGLISATDNKPYIVKQALIARFVNEQDCKLFLEAYEAV